MVLQSAKTWYDYIVMSTFCVHIRTPCILIKAACPCSNTLHEPASRIDVKMIAYSASYQKNPYEAYPWRARFCAKAAAHNNPPGKSLICAKAVLFLLLLSH